GLTAGFTQLRFDVGLKAMIRWRSRRTRPQFGGGLCVIERRRTAEIGAESRGREQNQEGFRAEHTYPKVKLRSRSRESSNGSSSAGGTSNSAANGKRSTGKN